MKEVLIKVCLITLVLFAFILPGFVLRKTKLVQSESLLSFANVLLYVCQPMLCIKAFAVDPVPPSGRLYLNFLYVFLLSFAAILLTFGGCKLLFLFMRGEEKRKRRDIFTFIGTFSNCTFVGIPFLDAFTGGNSEAVAYLVMFNLAFNILIWTLGAYLITQDKKQISLFHAFLNPCVVGAVIGFVLFAVPKINIFDMDSVKELQQIVVFTGNMTAPLSMFIVGVRLAELRFCDLFCDGGVYLAAFARLILSFGLTYLLLLPFRLTGVFASSPYVLLSVTAAMSMPPASTIVAFAEKYGGEKKLAAAAFSTGTLLSLFTLPCVFLLLSV